MSLLLRSLALGGTLLLAASLSAQQPFRLPTANRALFEPGNEAKFFVETVGKTWTSGCFGCVRSDGWQMHEGLDIRCLQRDKRNEPTDPVFASADGTVVYINRKPALSNYGNYVVLKHRIDGLDVYSLYAHIQNTVEGLKVGQTVRAGETIAIMGRTTNTREGISKERAHVHFEINLLVSPDFVSWFKKNSPGERNDHGIYNGQNLLGLDPTQILRAEQKGNFNLVNFLRDQPELFRVTVRKTNFTWLRRYPELVRPNPKATQEGIAGYELVVNYNGVPFQIIPRSASQLKGTAKYRLISVNAAEYKKSPCRRLVVQKGGRWELGPRGIRLLDLLSS